MGSTGDSFVHLHVHTEYSMLDGAARIADVVRAASADGQPAIGITDHGNMYGVLDFYRAARDQGLVPIIGTEAYMAGESRFERPVRKRTEGGETADKLYYHLTLLAMSTAGYRNLIKLSSTAFLEGYYYKPRVDWELLSRHHEGLIATTGCLGSVVCQAILRDDLDGAVAATGRLRDIFGPENLFIELQDHGLEAQHRVNVHLLEMSQRMGLPLLATNDSHYTHQADAVAHDALLCVQTGAQVDDPKRFKFEGDQFYLKSAAEMRHLFAELPAACDNTLAVGERAQVEIEFGKPELPRFELPPGVDSEEQYLRQLTYAGARRRYGSELPSEVTNRLEHELAAICQMGFAAYFLIVWDLIDHARRQGIRVGPGRGSAAGCCVAYCLRIVDLDPIAHGLLFERFLNPGRKEMPDIDMDFDERYRGEMIRYAAERYGADHVAQIVTFSTIKARAAVRDAARVLGYPYSLGDRIAKAMPPLVMGRDTPLAACLTEVAGHEEGYKMAAELRGLCEADPDAKRVVEVARGLAGLRRQDGIHAAAVVITREPLTEYLPVQRKPEPGTDPSLSPIVTQYEMHAVADLGLLKMDFLGLRNLTVIERALDLVEEAGDPRPPVDRIPLDDKATLEMLCRGDSVGVFQLEGGPMRTLMRSLAPTSFEDIAALVALYRPGPMAANMHNDYADRKNGRKPITYLHPDLAGILGDTQGLMIYQESMMRVAQHFAGYSLEEAENLRKACGKKIRAMIALEREKFVAGCVATGAGAEVGTSLFDQIEPFADYAFNKSHAYCYGFVAYQTAWLKAHHQVAYMAALLTSVKDDKDKTAVYLAECRNLGISVLVPDVNRSGVDFTPCTLDLPTPAAGASAAGVSAAAPLGGHRAISFGLSAVRNAGEGLARLLVAERQRGGAFRDFADFAARVDPSVLNKRSVESLIKAGAFESVGHKRLGLLGVFETAVDRALARRREADLGIMSLFGDGSTSSASGLGGADGNLVVPDVEFDAKAMLAAEKDMLGLYVSSHPLAGLESALRREVECDLAELIDSRDGEVRWVGGVVTNLARKYTRRGDLMATFFLEDTVSTVEVWVFPKTMATVNPLLANDVITCVRGRLDLREEPAKLVCLDVRLPDLTTDENRPLRLRLSSAAVDAGLLARLKGLLEEHPGRQPVMVHLDGTVLRLPDHLRVDTGGGLMGELRVLLGPNGLVA
ncbi:MAG: DNA polymerase III subunit alpha [Acidimicrobiales bacterium]